MPLLQKINNVAICLYNQTDEFFMNTQFVYTENLENINGKGYSNLYFKQMIL